MKTMNLESMRAECRKLPVDTQAALFRQLMCAVLSETVEDYVGVTPSTIKNTMPKYFFNKNIIMKDLESPRLIALTGGMSQTVAMHLRNNPDQIKENLIKLSKEYSVVKVETHETPKYR